MEGRERSSSTADLQPAKRGNSNNRVLIVLLVVLALVAIVAIIIAAVALSKPVSAPVINVANPQVAGQSAGGPPIVINSGDNGGGGAWAPSSNLDANVKRPWILAYGHDWGPHEYFDNKGYIQGFSKDIIDAVCTAGNMDCIAIWAPYSECWNSQPGKHAEGGRGLLDGWYDVCAGWLATTDRIHVFDFGMPYLKTWLTYFYVKKGNTFDASDLSNKKIGFVTGWASNEKCLARAGSSTRRNYVLKQEQMVYAGSSAGLVQLLLDDKVDAIFTTIEVAEKHLETIEEHEHPAVQCAVSGTSMMVRKDSYFLDEWNRAFQKLRSSGGFRKLCEEANKRHELHGEIVCVD